MTGLAAELTRMIRQTGPLTIADYMTACLTHPVHGYYSTRDPLGGSGDFITAPEISQMFGELIGLALAQSWRDQGSPDPFRLVELGPGRGTLMADALRAARAVDGFDRACDLHLVEISPTLRKAQSAALDDYRPSWHDRLATVPDGPLFLVANEFFDALPVRQFLRDGTGWSERTVGLDDQGALVFGRAPRAPLAALDHRAGDTRDSDLVELCAPAGAIAAEIGGRIATFGGVGLILDYGDWRSLGDTLQALRGHRPVDVLDTPGSADLTAHVDFEVLASAACAAGARHSRLTPQGVFLERLGITPRARALAAALQGAELDAHIAAHRRLTHPQEMGNLFKAMALFPPDTSPPPGLET